jgi:hypothetical protein
MSKKGGKLSKSTVQTQSLKCQHDDCPPEARGFLALSTLSSAVGVHGLNAAGVGISTANCWVLYVCSIYHSRKYAQVPQGLRA